MVILITGGSKCGKSRIAEEIITGYAGKRYYIATMEPFGEEAKTAIERHRSMRADKGFETIERYTDVGGIRFPKVSYQVSVDDSLKVPGCVALLECMGNLCANEMFSPQGIHEGVTEKILSDIDKLHCQTEVFVIVTNQVGADGMEYSPETMNYIKVLGNVNAALAAKADVVIEAVCGIPVIHKGKKLWKGIIN